MKKCLIVILVVSLLTSCMGKTDLAVANSQNSSNIQPSNQVESDLKIDESLKRRFIFLEMVETDLGITETNIEVWKQFMKKELNITAEYSLFQKLSNSYIWTHKPLNEELQSAWYFESFKDKNLFSNMDEGTSLANISEIFDTSKYETHIVDYLTINEGIYFLPTYIGEEYMCRTYNNVVLEDLKFQVPTSTIEFYKLAEAVKSEYTSESGKDTYIASYNTYTVVYDLYDIFLAFGCFLNFDAVQPNIARNPDTGEISFISESEGFIAAIEYIQMLTEEGLLYKNTKGIIPDNVEIISLVEDNKSETFDHEIYGLYLKGINSKNVVYCKYDLSGFCFPGTKAKAEVKEFINIIENEVKYNNTIKEFLSYGIEGENYSINNKTIFLNIDCTDVYPSFRFNLDNINSVKIASTTENNEIIISKNEKIKEIVSNLDNELIYYADYKFKCNWLNGAERDKFQKIYFELCYVWENVFSGTISAQEGYLTYIKNIEEWYNDDILEQFEINN